MRIFAERDAIELKRKVDKLELELYHARLSPLGDIMRHFYDNWLNSATLHTRRYQAMWRNEVAFDPHYLASPFLHRR